MADLLFQAPIKYEPFTKNRFLVRFPTDIGIQTWQVKAVSLPKIQLNKKEMKFFNTATYFNSSYQWNPISMTLRDFIAPATTQALMEWVRLCAESATGRMGYAIGYAKNIQILVTDPSGVAVQEWDCIKCIPTDVVDFGEMDYADDEVREITLSIQPQYCIQKY